MRKKQQEERRLRRESAKWLLDLTNDTDWGMRTWDDLEQKSVPKHRNPKQILLSFLQNVPFAYPRRLAGQPASSDPTSLRPGSPGSGTTSPEVHGFFG